MKKQCLILAIAIAHAAAMAADVDGKWVLDGMATATLLDPGSTPSEKDADGLVQLLNDPRMEVGGDKVSLSMGHEKTDCAWSGSSPNYKITGCKPSNGLGKMLVTLQADGTLKLVMVDGVTAESKSADLLLVFKKNKP